jgi:hypothetical protein
MQPWSRVLPDLNSSNIRRQMKMENQSLFLSIQYEIENVPGQL